MRGKGICELLDRPLSVMDSRRCVIYDPETDYYERDRNGDSGCRGRQTVGSYLPPGSSSHNYLPYGGYYDYRRGDNGYYYGSGNDYYDAYGSNRGSNDYYPNNYYSGSKSCKGCQDYDYDYRKPFINTNWYNDRRSSSAGHNVGYRPYLGDSQKHGGNYHSDNIIWDILCFYKAK